MDVRFLAVFYFRSGKCSAHIYYGRLTLITTIWKARLGLNRHACTSTRKRSVKREKKVVVCVLPEFQMFHSAFLSLFNSFISHSSILLLIFYYFRYVSLFFSFYNDCHFIETVRLCSLFCLRIQYSAPHSSSVPASLEFPVFSKRK